jgi:hypothetical protein
MGIVVDRSLQRLIPDERVVLVFMRSLCMRDCKRFSPGRNLEVIFDSSQGFIRGSVRKH